MHLEKTDTPKSELIDTETFCGMDRTTKEHTGKYCYVKDVEGNKHLAEVIKITTLSFELIPEYAISKVEDKDAVNS